MVFSSYSYDYNIEQPSLLNNVVTDRLSPSNWIKENQIKVYDNKVVIEIENAEWAKFTDTNSMDPTIDKDANAIEIIPKDYRMIKPGDIISYEVDGLNGTIIHRVIEIDFDEEGWYAITKGDNLKKQDPYKIRFRDIKRVVVAIIY